MVSTGSDTSGSRETGSWPSETAPSSTKPRVTATVVTGRLSAAAANDMLPELPAPSRRLPLLRLLDHPYRRVVGQGQVPLDQHHVTRLERDLPRRAVGQHFRVHPVAAAREDVDPLGAALLHYEDEGAPV